MINIKQFKWFQVFLSNTNNSVCKQMIIIK